MRLPIQVHRSTPNRRLSWPLYQDGCGSTTSRRASGFACDKMACSCQRLLTSRLLLALRHGQE